MTAPATTPSKRQVLNATPKEEALLETMIDALTQEELLVAANGSHEHLVMMTKRRKPSHATTRLHAKLFAQRFLKAKDMDADKALKRMKETIQFRLDMDIDKLRMAFDGASGDTGCAKRLEQEMQAQNVYVQGFDKDGRSTYIFVPRNVHSHDEEWTIKQHVYNLERAVAASRAADKTVNAVVDFNGFSLRNAPPTHIGKEFMKTFRNHYAGAIHGIYLVDAPASFHCLWNLFKPLVGKKTRGKIHFVQSSKNELAKFYKADQAAPWMMRGGQKSRELDTHEYLHRTPFHCAFNE